MTEGKSTLRYGLVYFFYYLAGSMFYSFFTLYLKTGLNYSGSQIGLIAAIGPIIGSLMIPVWGILTDVTRKPRVILFTAFAVTAGLLFTFNFTHLTQHFAVVFVMAVIFNACFRPLTPLTDNFVTSSINGSTINFNRIRAWGSLGFALGGLAIGIIIDKTSINALFYVPVVLFFIAAFIVITSPKVTVSNDVTGSQDDKPEYKEIVTHLMRNSKYVVATMIAVLTIASFGSIVTFNSIIITELGGDIKLAGILAFAGSALEVPIMIFLGQKLIEKKGTAVTLRIATGTLILRCIAAYFINNPYLYVAITATNGITVALLSPTMVLYIRSVVDSRMTASAFTFYVTFGNIGMALGALGLGSVMQYLPVRFVFLFAGVLAIIATLLTFKLDALTKCDQDNSTCELEISS